MPALADLTLSFLHVQLKRLDAEVAAHTINHEYPVVDFVLPEDGRLHLLEPANLARRPRPPLDPREVGVYDTSIFAVLPITPPNDFYIPVTDSAAGLTAAVDEAASEPGTTTVEIVSFVSTSSMTFRFRLVQGSRVSPLFELTESEWGVLREEASRVTWVRLLVNLVERGSARSYYHVQERLYAAYSKCDIATGEWRWSTSWNAKPTRNARELLESRMSPVPSTFFDNLVQLPCGHTLMIRDVTNLPMNSAEALAYRCTACNTAVLQSEDVNELMFHIDTQRATYFAAETSEEWQKLEQPITDSDSRIRITGRALQCALTAALGSLRAPALISPPELCFLSFPETTAVFEALDKQLPAWDQATTITPWALSSALVEIAEEARKGGPESLPMSKAKLPPGWGGDVNRWLTRAVRLVTDRGCRAPGPEHVGFHKHGSHVRCGVHALEDTEESILDGADGEQVISMETLAARMGDASLGEAEDSIAQESEDAFEQASKQAQGSPMDPETDAMTVDTNMKEVEEDSMVDRLKTRSNRRKTSKWMESRKWK